MDEVVGAVDQSGADRSSRSVYAAVGVISAAYFFAFVCYSGTDGLQTAGDDELPRSWVTAVICVASVVSSVLLAPVFVSRLSPNMALCVAWGSHALYAMANLYPTAGTLLPAAVVVGATLPAVAVAQGVYTTALVDKWCDRQSADAGGDEDTRLADVDAGGRSRNLQSCAWTRRTINDSLRRQNVFVFFNSVLMVCHRKHWPIEPTSFLPFAKKESFTTYTNVSRHIGLTFLSASLYFSRRGAY